jgi:hypothetical protein
VSFMRLPLASRDRFPRDPGMGSRGYTITPSRSGAKEAIRAMITKRHESSALSKGNGIDTVTSYWSLCPR